MENRNVMFLHKDFSAQGGVERVHKNLSQALESQQVSSSFFVYNVSGQGGMGYAALADEFKAVHAPVGSFTKKLGFLFDYIKRNNISVIISAKESANMLAFLCALRFRGLSVIYTRHCAFDVSDQDLPPWAIKCLYNFYALTNQTIVTVSDSLKQEVEDAIKLKKQSVYSIPNAVVSNRITTLASQKLDTAKWGDYFCAIGRLVEQKGFDLLLQSYAMAKSKNGNLPNLVIVGEGDDKAELLAQAEKLGIQDSVIFTGFTPNPYQIIKQSKAFILSSRHEGMPTVLIEALSLDTPVIAFDCPTGPSELITGDNGILVPAEDIEKLAEGILNYTSLTSKQVSQTVDRFTFDRVAQSYMAHF